MDGGLLARILPRGPKRLVKRKASITKLTTKQQERLLDLVGNVEPLLPCDFLNVSRSHGRS